MTPNHETNKQFNSNQSSKQPITNQSTQSTANDDWLANDPLGFSELEETIFDHDSHSTNIDTSHTMNESINPNSSNLNSETNNNGIPNSSSDMNQETNLNDNINSPNETSNTDISGFNEETLSAQEISEEVEFDGDTSRANPGFKPLLPDPINRGESDRQLIMDTETTGLDALKGDRIIEVGIVELVGRKFTGEKLHVYINPQRGMDEEVIRVHGISEAFLEDKPTFDKVAQKLYDFMYGAEVIAHNAPFDISFLTMEFDKVGLKDFADVIKVTDSVVLAKQKYPGQKNSLDALVRRLNVGKMDRTFHGALLDSEILAEVYLAMTGGQVSLAIDEELQAEGSSSHTDFSALASQILVAPSYNDDHVAWIASQLKSHPALLDTQNVSCFHKINDDEIATSYFTNFPTTQNKKSTALKNSLFIAQ